jgi:uncharacterized protein (DUF1330 family)
MAKGYWIAHVDVGNAEEYRKYVEANAAAFRKYKAVCLARGGKSEALEGSGRARNVIWEFPSYEAALECYRSTEYQQAKRFRDGHGIGEFILVEGLQDGPTPA